MVGVSLGAATMCAVFGAPSAGASTRRATSSPIKHIVVIYQENHSFDNVLGDLCVIDKRCAGSVGPISVAGHGKVAPHVASDVVPLVDHDVRAQTIAINHAQMNGWASVNGCQAPGFACLAYFTPDQIPTLAALARQFTIADHEFQANLAPSWGAHLALASGGALDGFTGDNPIPAPGVSSGPGWGCDSNRITPWYSSTGAYALVPSCIPDYSLALPNGGAFEPTPVAQVPTIMDRLDAAGLSWKLYTPPATGRGYVWAICPTFAECLYSNQANGMSPDSDVLTDAASGRLPAFSVVTPDMAVSQHNDSSMAAGDNWIGQVVGAVEQGSDWNSTAIFITWDDCGCFYDHVAPPTGEGMRAPMVIVSPFAKPGYTDSTTADVVGSILAYTEKNFGLRPLTAVDQNAYDFSHTFNYSQVPLKPRLLPRPIPATQVVPSAQDAYDPT